MGRRNSRRKQEVPLSLKRSKIDALCDKLFLVAVSNVPDTDVWNNYVKISNILEKIKQLEDTTRSKKIKTELPKRSQGIGQFMNWLKENGANIGGVSVSEFPGYDLGLKAEQDFKKQELILQIPRELTFSIYDDTPEFTYLQEDTIFNVIPEVALALALLVEMYKENSKWKPYLDILPKTHSTVLYMSVADMTELKGSPTLRKALKQCRSIARQYAYFNKVFHNCYDPVSTVLKDVFTYEKYCWAVSTVMTRQNLIPSEDGSHKIHALIPMWDMCNHENGIITTDFSLITNSCECYALRDFKKDEQIFISYGSRTNSDFFVHSGFVYMDNKEDALQLYLKIAEASPLYKERIELLKKLEIPFAGEYPLKPGPEPISYLLLTFLRIYYMNKPELLHWIRSDIKSIDSMLETAAEEKVNKLLYIMLHHVLTKYPTTLKEDLQLLKKQLPQTKKLAVQMRVTEKRILEGALEYVEKWMKT